MRLNKVVLNLAKKSYFHQQKELLSSTKSELLSWLGELVFYCLPCGHYSKPCQSKLLINDGSTTTSDLLETGKVFCNYFTKVLNNIFPTDDFILDSIAQCKTFENLGATPTITEVRNATRKMANRKAVSKNKVLI